jgi:hypothetical protein
MQRLALCLIAAAVLFPLADLQADETSELQSVIEKSVESAGGLENLDRAQKHRGREEGTFHGVGDGMPFTAVFASDPPNRFRIDIHGVLTTVVTPAQGWVNLRGTTQPMNKAQLQEQLEEQYIGWVVSLVPLVKQKDRFKLSSIEGEQVDGRETIGIEVASEGHRNVKLFIDKETHDLLKARYKVKSLEQGLAEVDQELIVKKHMEVAGAKLPSEMVILRDGQKYVEAKITEIEPVQEFADAVFAKP